MRVSLYAAVAALVLSAGPARAAATPVPAWADGLAGALADTSDPVPTNQDLAARFAPSLRFSDARCRTMRLPEPGPSAAPVTSAAMGWDDDDACDRPTRLQILMVGVKATPAVAAALQAGLARRMPAPCFAGTLPTDPRRRAPPRRMMAWHTAGRVVTVAHDAGVPGEVLLSLLILPDALGTTGGTAGGSLRNGVLASLPASCR